MGRAFAFNVGDRVQDTSTTGLNVHSSASTNATVITSEVYGATGTIESGTSQTANGYIWWYVTWDNGYTGWSVDSLQLISPATYTLNIASLNPSSGVAVSSYVGSGSFLSGSTPMSRSFSSGTVVGVTCPSTLPSGNLFQKWQLDGADYAFNDATSVTMNSAHTLTAIYLTPSPTQVTLTLYVHSGSTSGPLITGALVTGSDGAGQSFSQTTGAAGYVNITGTPGTWQFTASGSGFNANSWNQSITATESLNAFMTVAAAAPVTLTLYVHSGSASGPLITGALVTGSDGGGQGFSQTTGVGGYVSITGTPGAWQFTASGSGFNAKSWNQSIITTESLNAYMTAASASLALNSPNGEENWSAGTSQTVTWTVSGTSPSPISYYGIDYSLDGGSTWTYNAAYAFPPATSAAWLIPSTALTTKARIQVRAVNSSGSSMFWSYSANNFTISAPGQNPVANPTADNHAPQSGQQVNFTGSGSTDPTAGCYINSYLWNFHDGTTSTLANPSHIFYSPAGGSASYPVSLQVTDSCGNTGSNSLSIYVTGQALGNNPQQAFSPDPVNLATGNYTYNHVDLEIASRGQSFGFQRYYNSKATTSANLPLGFGWTHSYNIYLSINSSNSAVIAFGDGHQETYAPNGVGGYLSEPGIFNTLTSSGSTFTLTTKEQQRYYFNSIGQLASIADKNGNTITLTYTGNNLTTITDTVGRVVNFTYNANNSLTNISDPLGRSVSFAYDANTNLIGVTDLRGNLTQFGYDGFHQLTNAIDPRGNTFVSMVYDAQKRVVSSQKDALMNATTFSYDFVDGVTMVTDAMQNVSYNYYDSFLRVVKIVDNLGNVQDFEYDANNNRTKVIDKNGYATTYTYDGSGNVTSKTDPLGNTTAISYDSKNNPVSRTDALNGLTYFQYDSIGNLTNTVNALGRTNTYLYDAFGEPLFVTDANGNTSANTYDSSGNLVKSQDVLGGTNVFTYDIVSRKLGQVDALGRRNFFIYDNADKLIASVNALGNTNYSSFDGNNNRVTATDFLGNTTTSFYDQKDRLIVVRDPLGDSVTNVYDALDRKIQVTDARGNVTQYGFDSVGNLITVTNADTSITRCAYDANGNRTNIIDALGNSTTNIFDALNRLISTQDALGHTTASTYDSLGRRIQSIDALNRTNFFSYDAMGHLIIVTDAAGGTVINTYDNVGNRTSSTDPNVHTATNIFDVLNRVILTTDPAGGIAQLTYDAVGNVISRKDPNGNTTTYLYDANNRRTKITYPTGTPVTFGYDANGNRTSMTDSLGTTAYLYDTLNRLVSVTDCYGKTVRYGYDQNGNRTSMTYPGNKTVTYAYDSMNRLKTVTDWLNNITTYNYDFYGSLISAVNPNGTAASYQYDGANRLVDLTNAGPSSTIISSYAYTLDAVGNHSQVNQTEQLQTVPVVGQFSYSYDNDNKMVMAEGQAQSFDSNGNMASINGTNLLSYDFENRLTQTIFAGLTNNYQYDGTGNRVAANRNKVVTRSVLDRNSPLTQVLAETDSNGNVTAYYVYGIGLVSRIDAGGNARYYHFDSRGSTIALTDISGQITDTYAYDPFGIPIGATGSTDNRFRYLGRHGVVDEENGLNYIRARYYSAQYGRFVTKDPTTGKDGNSQSLNRYIYALNNPIRLIDISGLSALETSGQKPSFATSDTILAHNWLINPSTCGLVTPTANSTPLFAQQIGNTSINGDWINGRPVTFVLGSLEIVVGLYGTVLSGSAAIAGYAATIPSGGTSLGVAIPATVGTVFSLGSIVQGWGDVYSSVTGGENPADKISGFNVLETSDASEPMQGVDQ